MKTIKRIIAAVMAITLMVALVNPVTSEAAAKVKLNKTKATLTITDKKKKPAVTLKVTGTSKKATWSTSNKAVATVKNGKVTAKKAGKATITCKVSGKKYTCKVTVADKRITLNKTRATLTITDKVENPTVTLKVKNAKGKAVWSSSRPSVATVSNGKVTAHEDGSATITCEVNDKKYTCKINVVDKRMKLNKTSATLTITDSKNSPSVTLKVKNATKDAVWSSSNEAVATVSDGKVTAKKAGKATITCKVDSKELTCEVTVVDKRKPVKQKPENPSGGDEEPAECTHNWEEHWAVLEKEGTCVGAEYQGYCMCGKVFLSEEEFQRHLWELSTRSSVLSDLERECGVHGKKAKSKCTTHGNGDTTQWSIRTEYIEYMQCTKCGERIRGLD